MRDKKANKNFFLTIINMLKESSTENIFITRANIIFNKYIEKYASVRKEYTSLQDVVEEIICYIEKGDVKVTDEEKDKIYSIREIIKTEFPYDKLEKYDKNLIINLYNSVSNNDTKSTESYINQLIDEIYAKDKKIYEQTRMNRFTISISIIGVIITIIFGIKAII
jgi:hypothetical protein